ncbi:hypothetical protein D9615_009090 [Tricholomella constricta]|uniref:SMODS and SLOG-associating 2TM effector domain-containing protein n=1 Tax=Tricholomella constricta TaxID=117010 RepID=A0A8H5LYB2_9AGAR|nr:hypothetical protein D9615_009090 [Tricholomella constricta]
MDDENSNGRGRDQASLNSTQPMQSTTAAPTSGDPALTLTRSAERSEEDTLSVPEPRRDVRDRLGNPLPPLPLGSETRPVSDIRPPHRTRTFDTLHSGRPRSGIDWIVPIEEKPVHPQRTVGERLAPTLARAHLERDKYAMKAKMTGYALNAAIGVQVLLGSLTTGLSAAATSGKQAAIATTILGGLSTLVASYLARARGSNEPELSITRVKDLEQFIRECQAFEMDFGHTTTGEYDEQLFRFRSLFEELLGNGSGERKLSPPV